MTYRYLIASGVGTDCIRFPDGRHMENLPGGAGFYALTGLLVWSPDALMLAGVGPDYLRRHGAWYARIGCPTDGLIVQGDVTPTSTVTYFEDGEREDRPNVGLRVFRSLDATVDHIESWLSPETRGVYVFKDLDREFLDRLSALKKQHGFKVLWEISADAAIPENTAAIETYLADIDIFSINRTEAFKLYGTSDPLVVIHQFTRVSPNWVYFRMGADGAYVIADSHAAYAPAVSELGVVDPTGCGNSASAGVLYGACEGASPLEAGLMGAISAAFTLGQFGPPPEITNETRAAAKAIHERLLVEHRGNDQ